MIVLFTFGCTSTAVQPQVAASPEKLMSVDVSYTPTTDRLVLLSTERVATVFALQTASATPLPTHTTTLALAKTVTQLSPTLTVVPITSMPTSSLPISSAPNELRMAYVVDGNLYFQDGSNSLKKLTNGGEDRSPILFSESGDKIFFFRGKMSEALYSISTDGSNEQVLATNNQLNSISSEYDESTLPCDAILVHHTPFLLFHTCFHPYEETTIHNDDLFMINTNTGQVKRVFASGQGGAYYVSPNGSMLAVDRLGYIDIVDINGKMLRPKVATYTLSEPIPLAPQVFWKSDSSGFVIVLPTNTHYDTAPDPRYQVWNYSLAGQAATQIDLTPAPVGTDSIRVSPDGNWILYTNYEDGLFYLGDLRNGHTQSLGSLQVVFGYEWSADSIHFVYGIPHAGGRGISLGSVNSTPSLIGKGDFIGWLDDSRYLYITDSTILMGEIGGIATVILTDVPISLFPGNPAGFVFNE